MMMDDQKEIEDQGYAVIKEKISEIINSTEFIEMEKTEYNYYVGLIKSLS